MTKAEKKEAAVRSLEAARIVAAGDPRLVRAVDWTTFGSVAASLFVLALSGEFPIALTLFTLAAIAGSLVWGRSDLVTAHRTAFNIFNPLCPMYCSVVLISRVVY